MSIERDEEPRSIAGRLLIATPILFDPNFHRTVIYIIEHTPQGAMGVVLNRPTEESVETHLPQWAGRISDPAVVFIGGPVANEVAIGVARQPEVRPEDWMPTADGIGLLDLAESPDQYGRIGAVRVFSGYSGWIAGQLDMELRTGSWVVATATPDDVFSGRPESLWREVLKRQPDKRSLYASFPDDLRSN